MPGRLWDLLKITSSVSGSTTSETQKRCLDPLLPRCTCVSLHLNTASSGFLSIFLHFTVTSLRARTLSYNCSSHALLRDRPRMHRCIVNVCCKTTTKIVSSDSVLFVDSLKSSSLKLLITTSFSKVMEEKYLPFTWESSVMPCESSLRCPQLLHMASNSSSQSEAFLFPFTGSTF